MTKVNYGHCKKLMLKDNRQSSLDHENIIHNKTNNYIHSVSDN